MLWKNSCRKSGLLPRTTTEQGTVWSNFVMRFNFSFPIIMAYLLISYQATALTANKVWMELRSNGRFRVYVNYTIPELKQMREAWVEFGKKTDADRYFINLARGGDFFLPNSDNIKFQDKNNNQIEPW